MPDRSDAVVFIGMVYPFGGIRHFGLLGNEIFRQKKRFSFYFASITRAPDEGFWDAVRAVIPQENILEAKTFEQLVSLIVGLLKSHRKVLVHTGGGWGQTKWFVQVRSNLSSQDRARLILVATTHSFRNDSLMRIPMSVFQFVLYRLYYRMVVFQCKYAARRFVGGRTLMHSGRGVVIPLGCEPFPEPEGDVPEVFVEKKLDGLLLDETLFKFVYLAGFRPGKMHVWLVKAMAPVLRSHPNVRVLLCGTGESTVMDATRKVIAAVGLERQILVTEQIPRRFVPWLLQHCDCALVPSKSETFGHSFLEPMFAGLPVLGTDVGVGAEIIKNGETGYVFSLRKSSSLQNAMERLLVHPEQASKMGKNAERLVATTYRHQNIAIQLSKLYRSILDEEIEQ